MGRACVGLIGEREEGIWLGSDCNRALTPRNAGGQKAAGERGLMRSEGRDYIVQDGDVMLFRHNA